MQVTWLTRSRTTAHRRPGLWGMHAGKWDVGIPGQEAAK